LCLHDLITHHVHIFNNFWICWLFSVNIEVLKW
jgi:hypothetical protein